MELGTILKDKRLEKAYTQEHVADKLFVSRQTISNWENSKTIPDIESLIDLANFYDLSLDNILLKGTDIVENIKKKEKIAEIRKGTIPFLISTILTMVLLFKILAAPKVDIVSFVICLAIMIVNLFIILYFAKEENKIKGLPFKTKSFFIMVIIGALVGLIIGAIAGHIFK
ncbi:helix-turn-helix domain-containing protein [Floricoccus penangensis]|uniref:helix-turn-helix domain-containing protein n=1 Tax=Floricoccus penangensis TaxID=1859475 RepID=UPI0020404973|nr:helix-turn-helix domain-containing protein [Floricoccus penangensis]URZ87488.1 helix-turn-helix domain-containing protein [Floricoccus penangensis]